MAIHPAFVLVIYCVVCSRNLGPFYLVFYFSHLMREARQVSHIYRSPTRPSSHGFFDIATFFGVCVWLTSFFGRFNLGLPPWRVPHVSRRVTVDGGSAIPLGVVSERW